MWNEKEGTRLEYVFQMEKKEDVRIDQTGRNEGGEI